MPSNKRDGFRLLHGFDFAQFHQHWLGHTIVYVNHGDRLAIYSAPLDLNGLLAEA